MTDFKKGDKVFCLEPTSAGLVPYVGRVKKVGDVSLIIDIDTDSPLTNIKEVVALSKDTNQYLDRFCTLKAWCRHHE